MSDVVAAGLCTQCGTCTGVCPSGAVSAIERLGGLLLPLVDGARCTLCGTCVRSCPGLGLTLGLPPSVDPFEGIVLRAYVGHATETRLREQAQSGGLVSALALHLLTGKEVEAVAVTTAPADGSLRPRPLLAHTPEEVLSARGSVYCASGGNCLLAEVRGGSRRGAVAAVTLGCQTQGLEKARREGVPAAARIGCRIGLFCDRLLLASCVDRMLRDVGIARKDAILLRYRSKAHSGWPGEVEVTLATGEKVFFPSSLRTGLKDLFTPPRCRLCFDKTNIYSDVAVGDPWGVSEEREGESVLLVRTLRGEKLVEGAVKAGTVVLTEIDPATVFHHQGLAERRRALAAYMRAWTAMGRDVPVYEGLPIDDPGTGSDTTDDPYARQLRIECRVAESSGLKQASRRAAKYRFAAAVARRSATARRGLGRGVRRGGVVARRYGAAVGHQSARLYRKARAKV